MKNDPQAQALTTGENAPQTTGVASLIERAALDPNIDLERLQALMDMNERVLARDAATAYTIAMNAAQAAMSPVRADLDNTQTRSKYASYAALDRAIRPIYTANGFVMDFNTKPTGNEATLGIIGDCSHISGHAKRYEIEMPADGKGAKGGDVMTKTHATVSAMSYGKRVILGMSFNLAVDKDDDGNAADGPRPLNMSQAKFWIRMEDAIQFIRTCDTFRKLDNMIGRLPSYRFFLPGSFVDEALRECELRKLELDRALAGKTTAPETQEPAVDHGRTLEDFERMIETCQDEAEKSECISEYESLLDGAPEEVWVEFNKIAGR